MKVAILGGGGCFAINFANYLASDGIDHFGIGRSGLKIPAFWQVDHYYKYHKLHLVDQLSAVIAVLDTERPNVIVNYAAQGEGAASFNDNAPDYFETNCVALTRLVCELRKRPYIKRFIQIGSSEVYGSPASPAKETDLLDPTSPYSISKAAFDLYLQSMWRTAKFPMNIVRPSNCYVEGQQLHRVIPKTIIAAMKGTKLPLHGGGKAEKSYMHAMDLSSAVHLIMHSAPLGATYNVGPDEPISIRDLVSKVAITMGMAPEDLIEDVPDRVGQDSKYHLDCSLIKELGWRIGISLESGLKGMVNWVKRHPELLEAETTYKHRR